jgi:hypothetical protein
VAWNVGGTEEIADTDEDDPVSERRDEAAAALADRLEAMHDDGMAELCRTHGVFNDLLTGALGRVDWREIADTILSDADIPEPATDDASEDAT